MQLIQGKDIASSANPIRFPPIELVISAAFTGGVIMLVIIGLGQTIRGPSTADWFQKAKASLMGLSGLAFVRGLGQSVKLNPSQSSRVKLWHLRFETDGSMHCAICGEILEPVAPSALAAHLIPSAKAAEALGSSHYRGWRCPRCAPRSMHVKVYESTSNSFAWCPHCQELTVKRETPDVIPSPEPQGLDVRVTNDHCVMCTYTNQVKEPIQFRIDSGNGSSSSGGDFSGGSSGGGGAGGDW